MSTPIEAISALSAVDPLTPRLDAMAGAARPQGATSFARMLLGGVDQVDQKLVQADKLASAFALDDSIPLHQVTYTLEQARLSFELMLQVRARLVEAYQEISRMQL